MTSHYNSDIIECRNELRPIWQSRGQKKKTGIEISSTMRQDTSETVTASQEIIDECSHEEALQKTSQCHDENYIKNNDAGYITSSNDSLKNDETWRLNVPPKLLNFSEEESAKILTEAKIEMEKIPEEKRREWLVDRFTERYSSIMPTSLIELTAAHYFHGDSGVSEDSRPDWLDIEKFRRGQKFAMDNILGVFYADIISLFIVHSFDDGLNPLIFTDLTSTPYDAFKRYLSTASRMQSWYESDPWTPGTTAYNNIRAVRRMHTMVRKRIEEISVDEYKKKTSIKDAWCPALERTRRDMESACPAPKPGQCPHLTAANLPELQEHRLNQSEMSATQFAFSGLATLHPKFFGIHDATDEDLEAYLHMWRGIGYLLGTEDEFNFCRGSLEEVRTRSRDILEHWVKPNFRVVRPEWEHMMRCMVEGLKYYFPVASYETCILDVGRIMNLHMPRTYESLSYVEWIRHNVIRFYFDQASKLASLKAFMNGQLQAAFERARSYDKQKHQALKERFARTIDDGAK